MTMAILWILGHMAQAKPSMHDALRDHLQGTYERPFLNRGPSEDEHCSKDILKIAKGKFKESIEFELHLYFFSNHACNLEGVANRISPNAFIFDQYDEITKKNCAVIIKEMPDHVLVEEVGTSCVEACGNYGRVGTNRFPYSARANILAIAPKPLACARINLLEKSNGSRVPIPVRRSLNQLKSKSNP